MIIIFIILKFVFSFLFWFLIIWVESGVPAAKPPEPNIGK